MLVFLFSYQKILNLFLSFCFDFASDFLSNLPPDKCDMKRRRPERIRREKINLTNTSDMENRRRSRSNSQSDPIRRGRGRPKSVGLKKQEEEKGELVLYEASPG